MAQVILKMNFDHHGFLLTGRKWQGLSARCAKTFQSCHLLWTLSCPDWPGPDSKNTQQVLFLPLCPQLPLLVALSCLAQECHLPFSSLNIPLRLCSVIHDNNRVSICGELWDEFLLCVNQYFLPRWMLPHAIMKTFQQAFCTNHLVLWVPSSPLHQKFPSVSLWSLSSGSALMKQPDQEGECSLRHYVVTLMRPINVVMNTAPCGMRGHCTVNGNFWRM